MIKNKIIFVGGIHGVGKGTFCKQIAKEFDIRHLTASEVLKWNEISDLENKKVQNISSTQERLTTNLSQIIKPKQKYLLDGHFTLFNSRGVPEKIEDSTFEEIQPISIILLTDDPKIIMSRLDKRDNFKYDLNIIKRMQKMETEHANYISIKLKIPLFKIKKGDIKLAYNYLESL